MQAKSKGRESKLEGWQLWHYLAVKKTLREVISIIIGIINRNDFWISWWLLFSELPSFFRNRKKLESHKDVCKNKHFWKVMMLSEDTKII